MGDVRPDIPHIDATVTARNGHELAEAVAVACYHQAIMPMIAAIDGMLRLDPARCSRHGPRARRCCSPTGGATGGRPVWSPAGWATR
jgi:hypothetical protein